MVWKVLWHNCLNNLCSQTNSGGPIIDCSPDHETLFITTYCIWRKIYITVVSTIGEKLSCFIKWQKIGGATTIRAKVAEYCQVVEYCRGEYHWVKVAKYHQVAQDCCGKYYRCKNCRVFPSEALEFGLFCLNLPGH